ncbi:GAF domain-containing protein [Pseudomonas sp. ADAK13]|uniref:GAF domain-containing protein n=1 Tax=Pseudomonas sp. ADAK13 TaxID=2730847 RepID=UPI001462AE6D|nr:GAF domain-containing protein [Pseudomonas sp. ADAK13]QJI38279.1 GAF domain-containing protein [Pseudomonas sp. ADAK13]
MAKSSSVFDSLREDIDALAKQLGVSSVLVMRSLPQHMQVEASGGHHEDTYPIGAQGKKSSLAHNGQALYCERVVDTDQPLYVKDSRLEADWAGNEDEVEFGLSNYLGYPVRGPDGEVYGTVCALHEEAKEYSAEERAALDEFRNKVELAIKRSFTAR